MKQIKKRNFKTKIYKRLAAMIGSIIGVLAMLVAVCMGKNILGTMLLILCICIGFLIGNILEKKQGER